MSHYWTEVTSQSKLGLNLERTSDQLNNNNTNIVWLILHTGLCHTLINYHVDKVTRLLHSPAFKIKHSPLVQEAVVVISKVSDEGAIWTEVGEGKRSWRKHNPLWKETAQPNIKPLTGILLLDLRQSESLLVPQMIDSLCIPAYRNRTWNKHLRLLCSVTCLPLLVF